MKTPARTGIGSVLFGLAAGIHEGLEIERRYDEMRNLTPSERSRRGISSQAIGRYAITGRL